MGVTYIVPHPYHGIMRLLSCHTLTCRAIIGIGKRATVRVCENILPLSLKIAGESDVHIEGVVLTVIKRLPCFAPVWELLRSRSLVIGTPRPFFERLSLAARLAVPARTSLSSLRRTTQTNTAANITVRVIGERAPDDDHAIGRPDGCGLRGRVGIIRRGEYRRRRRCRSRRPRSSRDSHNEQGSTVGDVVYRRAVNL